MACVWWLILKTLKVGLGLALFLYISKVCSKWFWRKWWSFPLPHFLKGLCSWCAEYDICQWTHCYSVYMFVQGKKIYVQVEEWLRIKSLALKMNLESSTGKNMWCLKNPKWYIWEKTCKIPLWISVCMKVKSPVILSMIWHLKSV